MLAKPEWKTYNKNLFSPKGRIGRLDYFLFSCVLPTVANLAIGFLVNALGGSDLAVLAFLLMLPVGYIGIVNAIKRAHDLKHSGYFIFWFLVPVINLIAWLFLLFHKTEWDEE